jgi:mRNA interferase MazF
VIRQGEIHWLRFGGEGSEPAGRRPAVIVQHDAFNRSALRTTVVAAVTSNLALAAKPGNVRLRRGEANLPRPSVVNVTQLMTIDRSRLDGPIGILRQDKLREILSGIGLVFGLD